jgi:hypothetical protein
LFAARGVRAAGLLCVLVASSCWAANAETILPKSFAGWTQAGAPSVISKPEQADSAYPAVLNEYGFTGGETATYTRDDGRTLTIKAARFKDATGASGAFTFYRQPTMNAERIGTKAASANERVLFFRDNVLVEAKFDRLTAMSAAELRELAAALPELKGPAAQLPSLWAYLPKEHAQENTARYLLGPQALAASQTPLPAEALGFDFEPEILTQNYTTSDGPVTLMLVEYPTPQIATDRLKAFQAAGSLPVRRTGPILVIESGATGSSEAKDLLNAVNYEAEITWNEATSIAKKDNVGNLLIAVFGLIGILLLIGLVFGVFLGGIRVLVSKYFPGTVLDVPENVEILQLHLDDHPGPNK